MLYQPILKGRVVHGKGKGKKAGFPTANLSIEGTCALPPYGVYASILLIKGVLYAGVTNVGTRPTADQETKPTIETLILDFDQDIYGEEITLYLHQYIRAIRKFDNLLEVKEQIDKDKMQSKYIFHYKNACTFFSHSREETQSLGGALSKFLKAGDVLTLNGDLGAGKSEFSRGVAKGLGIHAPMPSPTFTILNAYQEGAMPLYHFDFYRIADEEELYEMGVEEQILGEGVSLIEWAQNGMDLIPKEYIEVIIRTVSDNVRTISIIQHGTANRQFDLLG